MFVAEHLISCRPFIWKWQELSQLPAKLSASICQVDKIYCFADLREDLQGTQVYVSLLLLSFIATGIQIVPVTRSHLPLNLQNTHVSF